MKNNNRVMISWILLMVVLTILVEVGYAWRLWSSTMIQEENRKKESGNDQKIDIGINDDFFTVNN